MTTIIIRLKSLIVFGLVLLSISFIWLGVTRWDKYKDVFKEKERLVQTAPAEQDGGKEFKQPVVAIVQEEKGVKDDFFSEYKMERERTRSGQIEILREIVSNPNSSAQMRQEAQQKLIKISDNLEKESKIENALVAKGFKEAIVEIQPEAVMVIVPSNGLRQDEIARISDIVIKVSGCRMEDVVIVPKSQ